MNKKIVSTALAGLMAVSSMPINVFAVDPPSAPPDNSSTGGTSQAVLNQEATMFSATVPTALPISVDQDNKVVVATDAKVINGSSGPIVISNIQLLENHGWTLTKTPTKKVGKQEVDFNIKTANKIIPAAKETAIIYDATVSPQKVAVTNAPVLDVIFTVDWDSYGSTVVSASKSTLLPDELSSLTVEGTTESDLFVWKNSNKAVAVLEPLPESHSVMSTFALLPEGQEELTASRKMGVRALAPGKTTVTVTDASGNAITQEIVVIDNLLDRIYVHTQPTKKEYFEGEVFDPAGMQVNAVYMDGSEYPLTLYGYSKQPLVMGQNQVTISYDEKGVTKTTNVSIVVKAGDRDISLLPTTNGTFSTDKTKAVVGEEVVITTTPAEGYILNEIKVNGKAITGNKFTMTADNAVVEVTFKAVNYKITKTPSVNGSYTLNKETAIIGDQIIVVANPVAGYKLSTIRVDGVAISGTSFTMKAKDMTVEVEFAVNGDWTAAEATAYGYKFTQNATSATITGVVNKAAFTGDKTIPDSINGKPVTSIGNNAFYECLGLANITIPNSVTSIGKWVFYNCTGLININIPNSVKSIGDYAVNGCSNLTNISIPSSVTNIGDGAFARCVNLTNISIPSSVTNIGDNAFSGCLGLTSITSNSPNFRVENQRYLIQNNNNLLLSFAPKGVTSAIIPNSVTDIGNSAFYGCTGLTSVVIPNSVTSIGKWGFDKCTNLTRINIPNSVTSIGDYVFRDCSSLASISIPSSVTSIGYVAFYGCTNLTNISIPNSVTSIGESAFSDCFSLTNVTIPSSVTSIGYGAFQDCTSLTSINIAKPANSLAGAPWRAPKATVNWNYGCWTTAEATVYGYKFTQDATSTTITGLSNSTTFAGDKIIPDSIDNKPVTSIGKDAFYNCSGLTSITIPSSVTSIGGYVFQSCTGLTSITIPTSVTSIDYGAFKSCTGLTSIVSNSPNYRVEEQRYLIQNSNNLLITFAPKDVTSATIPNSVTSIGDFVFRDCTGLTSIDIPSSVTSIGDWAFWGCSGLTNITIPSSVTRIGDYAFSNCPGPTNIVIPSSVTSIGNYAFGKCTGLTNITIPSSVTSIGYGAFSYCYGLTSINIAKPTNSISGAPWDAPNAKVNWNYKG